MFTPKFHCILRKTAMICFLSGCAWLRSPSGKKFRKSQEIYGLAAPRRSAYPAQNQEFLGCLIVMDQG
ncbi:MAG: hypothetical protein HC857_03180 [Synechococcales cyanobacterium RU_4_20]|nr:hypothetical protein [Synechococcales cyanobacterium RU_4_20]